MKNYSKTLAAALMAALGLSSCLKEDPVFTDNGSSGIVELFNLAARTTSTPYASISQTILAEETQDIDVVINYTGVNGASEDITVTLEVDPTIVEEGSTYEPVTSNLYTVSQNTVTIPKGQKQATWTITVKPLEFDLSKVHAIGVKITSATAGTISGNYSAGIYVIPVRSAWEGTYTVVQDWELPASLASYAQYYPETYSAELPTSGAGIRIQYIGDLFGGYTYYTFSDGKVNVTTSSATINATLNVIESGYDEETGTFYHRTSFNHPSYGDFVLIENFTKTSTSDAD